jgi:hypothetical protein
MPENLYLLTRVAALQRQNRRPKRRPKLAPIWEPPMRSRSLPERASAPESAHVELRPIFDEPGWTEGMDRAALDRLAVEG